jgi:hypothetical protein
MSDSLWVKDYMSYLEQRELVHYGCSNAATSSLSETEMVESVREGPKSPTGRSLKKKVTGRLPSFFKGRRSSPKKLNHHQSMDPPSYTDSFSPSWSAVEVGQPVEAGGWPMVEPDEMPELACKQSALGVRQRWRTHIKSMEVSSIAGMPTQHAELDGTPVKGGSPGSTVSDPTDASRLRIETLQSADLSPEDSNIYQWSGNSFGHELFADKVHSSNDGNLTVYRKTAQSLGKGRMISPVPPSSNLISPVSPVRDANWPQPSSPIAFVLSPLFPSKNFHHAMATSPSQSNTKSAAPTVAETSEQTHSCNDGPPQLSSVESSPHGHFDDLFQRVAPFSGFRSGCCQTILGNTLTLTTNHCLQQVPSECKASLLPSLFGAEQVLEEGFHAVQRLLNGLPLKRVEDAFAYIVLTLAALRTLHNDDELRYYAKIVSTDFVATIDPISNQEEQKDILLTWVANWSSSLMMPKPAAQFWEDPDMWLNMERGRTGREWPFASDFRHLKEGSHHICFLLCTGGFEYIGKRAQPSLDMVTTEYGGLALRVCLRMILSKCSRSANIMACPNVPQLCLGSLRVALQFIDASLDR